MKNLPAPAVVQQRLVRPELRFKSATNEWPTPDSLWKPLDDEFGFTLDVCSTHENAKCANHFTLAEDGLKQPWSGVAWMNPPYGAQLARWVKKCHDEAMRGVLVVGLIPVRSNTSYWHDYVMGNEIRFVRGYPKFGNAKQGLKAPLAVVIWRPNMYSASKTGLESDIFGLDNAVKWRQYFPILRGNRLQQGDNAADMDHG
jgi:site-specific DNA-methyltransferase (adenine-specific)